MIKIYIGNLARATTEEELRHEFEVFGEVGAVSIVRDIPSGLPKGFAFIEMPDKAEGHAAIAGLKGKVLNERTLDISEARPRNDGKGGKPFHRRRGSGFAGRDKRRKNK